MFSLYIFSCGFTCFEEHVRREDGTSEPRQLIHLHLPSILKWKTFPGLRLRTRPGHRTSCLPLVPRAAPSCCRLINPEGLSSHDGRPSRKWTDALKPPSKENIVFLHIQPRCGLLSPGAGRLGPQIVRRAFCFLSSRLSEMCRKTQLPDTDL